MAAGSSGAVAAVYLCMVVLNLEPLFGYTTHLAPLVKQHTGGTSLFAPATWLNIKHFGHGRHVNYSTFIWHSWQTLQHKKGTQTKKGEYWAIGCVSCSREISISTPSEVWGPAPKTKGIAAEIHASPAGFRRGKLAEQLALPEDCGSAPMASSLATENHKPTASSVCSTVNNFTEVKPRNPVFKKHRYTKHFQAVNQAIIVWDPRCKPKGLFSAHFRNSERA